MRVPMDVEAQSVKNVTQAKRPGFACSNDFLLGKKNFTKSDRRSYPNANVLVSCAEASTGLSMYLFRTARVSPLMVSTWPAAS